MMDEDYPGLLLGLFYEQSLTDNTWTQHSAEHTQSKELLCETKLARK